MLEMIKKNLNSWKSELRSYTMQERGFILFAMVCNFLICSGYALIRPVSNSLFISTFSAKYLPYAWLALVPLNFALVSAYNRLILRYSSLQIFSFLMLIVLFVNSVFPFLFSSFPSLVFVFYVWKEIYVLFMFQLLWSVIHANVHLEKAKYLYGILYGVGGLGSMVGALIPSFLAVAYGTEKLIFLTLPLYGLLLYMYAKKVSYCKGNVPKPQEENAGGIFHGIKLIRQSRFLIFALLIVVFMQMITAIVDFQFNDHLQRFSSNVDIRTQYSARILGMVHTITLALQFIGSYLLVQWIGMKRTHFLIPLLMALCAGIFISFPVMLVASMMYIGCKSLDFSLFGVVKEMLYIPLNPDEKFRAKAVIDIFAYRTAKAIASLFIIFMSTFFSSKSLTYLTLLMTLVWMGSVMYGLKQYETITTDGKSP